MPELAGWISVSRAESWRSSLEFELVRQIADAQWRTPSRRIAPRIRRRDPAARLSDARSHPGLRSPRPATTNTSAAASSAPSSNWPTCAETSAMRRLTRLETGFIAAPVDETRRYMEKQVPRDPLLRQLLYRRRLLPRPLRPRPRPHPRSTLQARRPAGIGFRTSRESAPQAGLPRRSSSSPTDDTHTNDQTNPISPNPCEIKRRLPIDQRQSRGRQPAGQRLPTGAGRAEVVLCPWSALGAGREYGVRDGPAPFERPQTAPDLGLRSLAPARSLIY